MMKQFKARVTSKSRYVWNFLHDYKYSDIRSALGFFVCFFLVLNPGFFLADLLVGSKSWRNTWI